MIVSVYIGSKSRKLSADPAGHLEEPTACVQFDSALLFRTVSTLTHSLYPALIPLPLSTFLVPYHILQPLAASSVNLTELISHEYFN